MRKSGDGAVERLIKAPPIGFLGGEGVASSVREQDVFSGRSRRAVVVPIALFVASRGTIDRRFLVGSTSVPPTNFSGISRRQVRGGAFTALLIARHLE